jgi:hypothetical protein
VKVTVHPAVADELRETAKFYSERANQALGMAFIAEFERALNFLSNNPELSSFTKFMTIKRFTVGRALPAASGVARPT